MTKVSSFRIDPKLIKLAKSKFGNPDKTKTSTVTDALSHVLSCPNFDSHEIIVYSVKDVAELFGCAEKTIYRWIDRGLLSAHKVGTIGIFPSDILNFLKHFNDDIPPEVVGLMSKMSLDSHTFITPKQAIKEYNIPETTMYRWISQGKVRHLRISEERIWLFRKSVRRKVNRSRPKVEKLE